MQFLEKDLNQLIQFWNEEPDTLRTLRSSAYKKYKEVGLPNKKWEGWQFTDFSALNHIAEYFDRLLQGFARLHKRLDLCFRTQQFF